MPCKKSNSCLFFLLWTFVLQAQAPALDAAFYGGKIWRHTPKLSTRSGEWLGAQEFSLRLQTLGNKDWHHLQRYPALGIACSHFVLGEGSHGHAYGFMPFLHLNLWRNPRWAAVFRVGSGLAWVSRPYDWFNNPGQNAIGSHWNNTTQFRLGMEWAPVPRLRLHAGGSLTHFSNGGAALPNFGLNIASAWMGAVWFPRAPQYTAPASAAAMSNKVRGRRLGAQAQAGYSKIEMASFDGPAHPVWSGAVAMYARLKKTNQLLLGVDYEYNAAIYNWGIHSVRFPDEASARKGATRLAVFAAEEFFFGRLSIVLQGGQYVGGHINQFVPKPRYAKLSARWYTPAWWQRGPRSYAGVSLKAHKFTAEYISANLGLSW